MILFTDITFKFFIRVTVTVSEDKQTFQSTKVNNFIPIIFSTGFGCTKEPSH